MKPVSTYNGKPMKLITRYCVLAANNKSISCKQQYYQCEITKEVKTTPKQDQMNLHNMEQLYKEIVQTKK